MPQIANLDPGLTQPRLTQPRLTQPRLTQPRLLRPRMAQPTQPALAPRACPPAGRTERVPSTNTEAFERPSCVYPLPSSLYCRMAVNLWTQADHALDYLERADSIKHRTEGESTLLEFIPPSTRRILDLGTGDGRLLALVKREHANTEAVAIDFSPAMLDAATKRFAGDSSVTVIPHNLDHPLPDLGKFDAVISSFAIHHVEH